MHRYASLKTRCEGRHSRTYKVEGMNFCTKEEFLAWCYSDVVMMVFESLYSNWEKENFSRKMCPSIDRIDSKKGYTTDNLQWITLSQNSSKG